MSDETISPSEAARILGRIRSDRKAAACRENGKKGGYPGKFARAADSPATDSLLAVRDAATDPVSAEDEL